MSHVSVDSINPPETFEFSPFLLDGAVVCVFLYCMIKLIKS